jgi:hypothetical protein
MALRTGDSVRLLKDDVDGFWKAGHLAKYEAYDYGDRTHLIDVPLPTVYAKMGDGYSEILVFAHDEFEPED